MQTRLIIIHEVNPQPAKPPAATRTPGAPPKADANGTARPVNHGRSAGLPRRPGAAACDSRRLVFVNWLPGRLIRCTGGMLAVALLLAAAGATVRAETPAGQFDAANAAYSQGRYAEAAKGFESALAQKGFSAPVLYNLANAQMREGRLGAAILNYERARTLAPNDPEIAANLKLAQAKVVGTVNPAERDARFMRLLTLDGWGLLAAAALLVACAAAILQHLPCRNTIAIRWAGAVAVTVFLVALSVLALRWKELDRVIVVARECSLRISPTSIGEQLFPLHEGDAVTLHRTRGEYALVRTPNGRAGWVKRGEIGRVYAAAQR